VHLHRSILIEVYDDHAVRLVSTDYSYVLARMWVPLEVSFTPRTFRAVAKIGELYAVHSIDWKLHGAWS
jgi:hypothetical protein